MQRRPAVIVPYQGIQSRLVEQVRHDVRAGPTTRDVEESLPLPVPTSEGRVPANSAYRTEGIDVGRAHREEDV